MSSVKYRQRLRERAQLPKSVLAGFVPVRRDLQTEITAAVAAKTAQPNVEQPSVVSNVVVPNTRKSMTPQELQQHARQLAQLMAGLPSEEYTAAMKSLEDTNETLYATVCDELENMNAANAAAEGDGHDLSNIATGN